MSTVKQKRAAKLVIENATLDKPLTGGEIVANSGYGVSMRKNPQVILESEGVKEALNDYGFNVDNAKRVVAEILLNPKGETNTRLKAADQVFKVHKSYGDNNTQINVGVKTIIIQKADEKE